MVRAIRNRAALQPVIVAAEADQGVIGFISFGLARHGDRPLGFVGARDAKVGEIYTLYVQPDFHERGIGRRLLAAAFAAMVERDYGCGFLWVLRDNPSRYFYERVGGKAVAERREPLWGSMVDQVCYGWPDLAQAIDRAARAREPRMDDRWGEWRGGVVLYRCAEGERRASCPPIPTPSTRWRRRPGVRGLRWCASPDPMRARRLQR